MRHGGIRKSEEGAKFWTPNFALQQQGCAKLERRRAERPLDLDPSFFFTVAGVRGGASERLRRSRVGGAKGKRRAWLPSFDLQVQEASERGCRPGEAPGTAPCRISKAGVRFGKGEKQERRPANQKQPRQPNQTDKPNQLAQPANQPNHLSQSRTSGHHMTTNLANQPINSISSARRIAWKNSPTTTLLKGAQSLSHHSRDI